MIYRFFYLIFVHHTTSTPQGRCSTPHQAPNHPERHRVGAPHHTKRPTTPNATGQALDTSQALAHSVGSARVGGSVGWWLGQVRSVGLGRSGWWGSVTRWECVSSGRVGRVGGGKAYLSTHPPHQRSRLTRGQGIAFARQSPLISAR